MLWIEDYRPSKIAECILPKETKAVFQGFVESGTVPNLLLSGSPGTGKTTVAKALCNELGFDYRFINGSDEGRSIDILRTTIANYASKVSFNGKRKIILLDEADAMGSALQTGLRAAIEEYSNNCGFILTANYRNKIIPAISESRCTPIEFIIPKAEKADLAKQMVKRCIEILKDKGIEYDANVVGKIVVRNFPDFRRTINELQKYSARGKIDEGILVRNYDLNTSKLFDALKQKEFQKVRVWVTENLDNDATRIYRKIYDSLFEYLKPESIPAIIILVADYQYKAAFCADQEIQLLAFLLEVMVTAEFN